MGCYGFRIDPCTGALDGTGCGVCEALVAASTAMASTAMASAAMASTAMALASVDACVSLDSSAEPSSMMQHVRKRTTNFFL